MNPTEQKTNTEPQPIQQPIQQTTQDNSVVVVTNQTQSQSHSPQQQPPQLPKPQQPDNAATTTHNNQHTNPLKRQRENSEDANPNNAKKMKLSVLTRTQSDLKRYLNGMDEDVLKNDLLPKLCESHKSLFRSIRSRMSENTILCKIFIRSLSYDTQDKTVYDMFTKFGNVKEAVIVKDRQTGKSRGFGFITMSNASEAQAALVEHRKMIDGREAICNLASKPQGQKTSTNNKKRDDAFHSHRDLSMRGKRDNPSPPNADRYAPIAPPHAYPYTHTTAPYSYDYNYQYPHYASSNTNATPASAYAAVNAATVNPYNAINPYAAANPYAQYNRTQTTNASTSNATQNTTSAASAVNPNTNIGNQPYVPSMAGQNVTANMSAFGAAPYRFN
eukprot:535689_1